MVMTNATTTRIASRAQKLSSATSSSAITMISADRIRSVRTAPATIRFSASGPISDARRRQVADVVVVVRDPLPHLLGTLEREVGAADDEDDRQRVGQELAEQQSASGRMISSLLRIEPNAIFLTIGSSRSAASPWTYCGVTAVSSTTTPAALVVARPAAAPTSSTDAAASLAMAATSSRSPKSPALTDWQPGSAWPEDYRGPGRRPSGPPPASPAAQRGRSGRRRRPSRRDTAGVASARASNPAPTSVSGGARSG